VQANLGQLCEKCNDVGRRLICSSFAITQNVTRLLCEPNPFLP